MSIPRAVRSWPLVLASLCASCSALEGGAGHHHDWRLEPHHLSVLLGSTLEEGETGPTYGIDYEYRVCEFVGLGAVAEEAEDDVDATTVLAVADLHVTPQFIFQTGPGWEDRKGEDFFVYRVGVLYEWVFDNGYTLSPQLHYDMTDEEDAVVIGFAIGKNF